MKRIIGCIIVFVCAGVIGCGYVPCQPSDGGGGYDQTCPSNCGNGVIEPGEECDDASVNCTKDCKLP